MRLVEIVLISVIGVAMLGLFSTLGFAYWHVLAPPGSVAAEKQRLEYLRDAYGNGQHEQVVLLYESPVVVRMGFDSIPSRSDYVPTDLLFKIGDSYDTIGEPKMAREQYLRIIGWTELRYDAFCRLTSPSCDGPESLRNLAMLQQTFAP